MIQLHDNTLNDMSKKNTGTRIFSCRNCGLDHLTKDCTQPITSYGLLHMEIQFYDIEYDFIAAMSNAYGQDIIDHGQDMMNKLDTGGVDLLNLFHDHIRITMVSRRVSLGFSQFARGYYEPSDPESISKLFKQMYPRERNIIETGNYLTIISYLDNVHPSQITDRYAKSRFRIPQIKFRCVLESKSRYNLSYYLRLPCDYFYDEWGFPKGRMDNGYESSVECALREFCEETGKRKTDICVLSNMQPLCENMIGTNGKSYRHIYYISISASGHSNQAIAHDPIEIGKVRSVNLSQAMHMIRPYHHEKKRVLIEAYQIIASHMLHRCIHSIRPLNNIY